VRFPFKHLSVITSGDTFKEKHVQAGSMSRHAGMNTSKGVVCTMHVDEQYNTQY